MTREECKVYFQLKLLMDFDLLELIKSNIHIEWIAADSSSEIWGYAYKPTKHDTGKIGYWALSESQKNKFRKKSNGVNNGHFDLNSVWKEPHEKIPYWENTLFSVKELMKD